MPPTRTLLLALAAALAIASSSLAQGNPRPPKRVALLVGINTYQKRGLDALRWAENDVTELADELRKLQFDDVVLMTSSSNGPLKPTRANILGQLERLLKTVNATDVVLVNLCGHGQQLDVKQPSGTPVNDAFFLPLDAQLGDPETLISLSFLTDNVLRLRGGKNLLIVDACRNQAGDADRAVRHRGIDGRSVKLPEDTAILFSCRADQKSEERDALKHGVFTHSVLASLREAGDGGRNVTWDQLVSSTKDRMSDLIDADRQEPIAASAIGRVVLGRRAAPAVGTRAGQERDDNPLRMKLVWCPPASYRMGSPPDEPDRDPDEAVVDVRLTSGFWIGKTEVTQDQWRQVMGTDLNAQLDRAGPGSVAHGEGPDHSMVYVSHAEAGEFCRRLTDLERKAKTLPDGWEYRLPTEARWEYACRAGSATPTAFGESLGAKAANFDASFPYNGGDEGKESPGTLPVARFKPNAWGLADMHGNVAEWCADAYAEALSGGDDPRGPADAPAERVVRGGHWQCPGSFCRSAARDSFPPDHRNASLGFRVVRVPVAR